MKGGEGSFHCLHVLMAGATTPARATLRINRDNVKWWTSNEAYSLLLWPEYYNGKLHLRTKTCIQGDTTMGAEAVIFHIKPKCNATERHRALIRPIYQEIL